ncbi:hypothetical protein PYCC9005_003188 [Savitreella phatthalungensis]
MKFSTVSIATLALGTVAASDIEKRQNAAGINDAVILNYALTLEHLENAFYSQALARYSAQDFINAGFPAPFYRNLQEISKDEAAHVAFLQQGLTAAGATPVQPCTYNFPYTSPGGFVTLAKALEGVGVSAYLGAAQNITSKAYLTAAAAILTVEARHTAYVRAGLRLSPFPGPFDSPLDFNEVYTLAAQFITGCPATGAASSLNLPVKAFPTLSFASSTQATSGASQQFTLGNTANLQNTNGLSVAFISGLNVVYAPAAVSGKTVTVTIPTSGLDGQVYALLTTQSTGSTVLDSNIVAGPAIVEIALPGANPLSA